jgi:hypothetical protein
VKRGARQKTVPCETMLIAFEGNRMAAGGSCQCRAVPWSVNDRNFWLPQGLNVVRIRRTYGTADPARFAGLEIAGYRERR